MSRGYTVHLCDTNRKADPGNLGVRLGAICIRRKIPVTHVAERLGVTRATVYNWFSGVSIPNEDRVPQIEAYIDHIE